MPPRTAAILAVAIATVFAGCAAPASEVASAAPTRVVLAIQPTDNADAIQDRAKDLETSLESGMRARGVEADVKILVPLTYVGVVEALRFGHADAAMMSAWPAAMASKRAGAETVLAELREVIHGETPLVAPYYYSHYVVLKDSPFETLADLRGKTVAYPSATSTSGYVYPLAKLVSAGHVPAPAAGKEADPKAFFGGVLFAGGYAQAWEALRNGQADVAVIAGDVSATLYEEVLAGTRIVETQGPVPSHGVVFAEGFEGPARDALKGALLDLKDDKRDLMRKLVSGIFVAFEETTTEKHTGALREALEASGLRFQEKLG